MSIKRMAVVQYRSQKRKERHMIVVRLPVLKFERKILCTAILMFLKNIEKICLEKVAGCMVSLNNNV